MYFLFYYNLLIAFLNHPSLYMNRYLNTHRESKRTLLLLNDDTLWL